ncbi:TPA: hypothetical protein DCG35_04100 [Candidatus Edwardsbacteria bacterium]|nr:hypothetical protein [Candidatus Edwardsbacteria bacterium]HBZ85826.1 hypothetical protein [Candidatus Edwardsbacteria bacterium]
MSIKIHPTAIIDPSAKIGPYSIIGPECVIGDNCHAHVYNTFNNKSR